VVDIGDRKDESDNESPEKYRILSNTGDKMKIAELIKEKAREYRNYTAECLSEMVKIPSVSCEEERVVLRIKELLESAGVKDVRIDGLGNLIAKVGNGPKIIAIDAHIDTVDTGDESQWDTPPFSGLIKDGFVQGRGTVDQEGGAASMIAAARILTEMNYTGEYSVYFTFTVMEEDCDGMCWEYLINEEKLVPDLPLLQSQPISGFIAAIAGAWKWNSGTKDYLLMDPRRNGAKMLSILDPGLLWKLKN